MKNRRNSCHCLWMNVWMSVVSLGLVWNGDNEKLTFCNGNVFVLYLFANQNAQLSDKFSIFFVSGDMDSGNHRNLFDFDILSHSRL